VKGILTHHIHITHYHIKEHKEIMCEKNTTGWQNRLPWTNQGFKKVLLHCLKRVDFTVWQVTFYAPLFNEQGPGK